MSRNVRRDRTLREHTHDPYRAQRKPQSPAACRDCGAVFRAGRWERPTRGVEIEATETCPSCLRVRERDPAGVVTLEGDFLAEHREEIVGLIRNEEARRVVNRPLQRIMNISDDSEGMHIETTDSHLARSLGKCLNAAYGGDLSYHYEKGDTLLRVRWSR
jgi:NMD protein affecting ribosome stability and mRNA decay